MLNPGSWTANRTFWVGFFNPQFVPQTASRTGGALLLASLYVYLHATFRAKHPGLRDLIAARSSRPALLGSILITLGGIGWYVFLPQSARAALAAAGTLNVLVVVIFAVTAAVFVMLYLGPYRNPGWLSPGFAVLFLALGLAAVATGEFIREAVRKPYVIYNVVMSNQILPEEIPIHRAQGYLQGGTWTKAFVGSEYPSVMTPDPITMLEKAYRRARPGEPLPGGVPHAPRTRIAQWRLAELPRTDRVQLGRTLFMHHCNDCHAAAAGYSAVGNLTRGWTEDMIRDVVRHPEQSHFFMPPWAGTSEEADLLTEYIETIAPPHPKGMYYGEEK
jgi:cytochrome d ubiquinol oxidase subunit I